MAKALVESLPMPPSAERTPGAKARTLGEPLSIPPSAGCAPSGKPVDDLLNMRFGLSDEMHMMDSHSSATAPGGEIMPTVVSHVGQGQGGSSAAATGTSIHIETGPAPPSGAPAQPHVPPDRCTRSPSSCRKGRNRRKTKSISSSRDAVIGGTTASKDCREKLPLVELAPRTAALPVLSGSNEELCPAGYLDAFLGIDSRKITFNPQAVIYEHAIEPGNVLDHHVLKPHNPRYKHSRAFTYDAQHAAERAFTLCREVYKGLGGDNFDKVLGPYTLYVNSLFRDEAVPRIVYKSGQIPAPAAPSMSHTQLLGDTGAAHHLISRKALTTEQLTFIRPSARPHRFTTANRLVESREEITLFIS